MHVIRQFFDLGCRMNTDALTIYARYRTLFRFGGTVVRVAKYLRHPGFVGKFYFNDIAILYVSYRPRTVQ